MNTETNMGKFVAELVRLSGMEERYAMAAWYGQNSFQRSLPVQSAQEYYRYWRPYFDFMRGLEDDDEVCV